MGDKLSGVFTLTNTTSEEQKVLIWKTPLEGLNSNCFKVIHSEKTISYDGKFVLHPPTPSSNSYMSVPAGGSVTADFDLSDAYFIENLGTYEIETQFKILTADEPNNTSIASSVSARFEIVEGGGSSRETEGMRHRVKDNFTAVNADDVGVATAPTIVGGTTAQQTAVGNAWTNAYSSQLCSISVLTRNDCDTIFKNTFKVDATLENKMTASGYYSDMKAGMEDSAFSLTINATQIGVGIAYTYLNSTTIWFNPTYFNSAFKPINGDFSQAAMMIQVLAHAVCGIQDCSDAITCSYTLGYFSSRIQVLVDNIKLQVKSSEQYLNISGASMENAAKACQGSMPTTDNFLWKIIPQQDGYVQLQVKSSGQYLNIYGASMDNSAKACQGSIPTTDNFLWKIISQQDGDVQLQVKSSGQYLNIYGASMDNGAEACQGNMPTTDNFLWKMLPA
ncbi:RICIN domain-containing protein [Shewanella surugensis]|uniref:RICIN domain-containing protein n=1 Tax=Shewanella surugensis TaxID=212020 RepID=A0ABT0LIN1_9GAMM|nr:RICIN domain-containing protein [Shewanella surugensis]MCL1127520.1 RICIN domain-containing protein [Shewanella surugensis]